MRINNTIQITEQCNNISNADMKHSGAGVKLPVSNPIFNPEQKETQVKENKSAKTNDKASEKNIFEEYDKWLDDSENVVLQFDDYDDYINNRESYDVPLTFDFMQGKSVQDEDSYNEQTLKMAQGELDAKDYNKDGEVSVDEYIVQEFDGILGEYKTLITEYPESKEEVIGNLVDAYKTAYKLFYIIDGQMGGDCNGSLNAQEFQNYFKYLDEYTGSPDHSKLRDGKIDIDSVTDYPEYLADQINLSEESEKQLSEIGRNIIESLLNIA